MFSEEVDMFKRLAVLALVLGVGVLVPTGACAVQKDDVPVRWEHGWKTTTVVATRYTNPSLGFNIGFEFPNDQNNCDRSELEIFMKEHAGYAYEMGGRPGAPIMVIFKDVKNREAADRKLQQILPALSKLVRSLR